MREPILAIEGALGVFSVALLDGRRLDAVGLEGNAALEGGLGLIESVLANRGLRLTELGGVAVGVGPGRFTGLRIAIAYAKSLALGSGLPLAGISSFDIVDAAANADSRVPRLTVVSGRAGIACIRRTERDAVRVACGPIEATVARVLGVDDTEVTLVGATEDVRSAILERGTSVDIAPVGPELPAATLARIARARSAAASLHTVAPDYGETPAVKIKT